MCFAYRQLAAEKCLAASMLCDVRYALRPQIVLRHCSSPPSTEHLLRLLVFPVSVKGCQATREQENRCQD